MKHKLSKKITYHLFQKISLKLDFWTYLFSNLRHKCMNLYRTRTLRIKKEKTIKRKNRKRNKKVGAIVEYIFQFSNLATKTGDFVVEVDAGIDMQLDFTGGCNGSGAKPLSAILANSIHAKLNILCKERERERESKKQTWIGKEQHCRKRRHLCENWKTLKWKPLELNWISQNGEKWVPHNSHFNLKAKVSWTHSIYCKLQVTIMSQCMLSFTAEEFINPLIHTYSLLLTKVY